MTHQPETRSLRQLHLLAPARHQPQVKQVAVQRPRPRRVPRRAAQTELVGIRSPVPRARRVENWLQWAAVRRLECLPVVRLAVLQADRPVDGWAGWPVAIQRAAEFQAD